MNILKTAGFVVAVSIWCLFLRPAIADSQKSVDGLKTVDVRLTRHMASLDGYQPDLFRYLYDALEIVRETAPTDSRIRLHYVPPSDHRYPGNTVELVVTLSTSGVAQDLLHGPLKSAPVDTEVATVWSKGPLKVSPSRPIVFVFWDRIVQRAVAEGRVLPAPTDRMFARLLYGLAREIYSAGHGDLMESLAPPKTPNIERFSYRSAHFASYMALQFLEELRAGTRWNSLASGVKVALLQALAQERERFSELDRAHAEDVRNCDMLLSKLIRNTPATPATNDLRIPLGGFSSHRFHYY